jgi:hypothetical protein
MCYTHRVDQASMNLWRRGETGSRLASIDSFRGFAVLAVVVASYLFGTEALPAWLRHAPDGCDTFPDLGASRLIFCFWTKGDVSAS